MANQSDEKDRGGHRDKVSVEEVQVLTGRPGRVLAVGAFSACRGLAPAQAEISHDAFCFRSLDNSVSALSLSAAGAFQMIFFSCLYKHNRVLENVYLFIY